MRLVFYFDGATAEIGGRSSDGPYPWLAGVGNLNIAARAGHLSGIGATESPNLAATIDNEGKQATALLGRPLRVPVDAFDDDDALFFSGLVSGVTYGPALAVTVEA